ncbi:MAG: peptidase M1 [Candidatus Marinimicrobia bacterium]|nr:peptidase M1 [Candidatus Neomarinimicrobiota bacterium]
MGCQSENSIIKPGVSWNLAQNRKAIISDVRYKLRFDIPKDKIKPIVVEEFIDFKLSDLTNDVVLDFRQRAGYIHSVTIKNKPVPYKVENQHIVIDASYFSKGQNSIFISFRAGDMSLNRNEEFLYTLFVPDRASTAIPCFDQPNLKARYSLTLLVPTDWTAIANGPIQSEKIINDKREIVFGETRPVSTYIFAFTAGKFKRVTQEISGRKMTMLHRETDLGKVARNKNEIFELHSRALSWMEKYTGIDYPYQKFDFALIPGFQYGGMEHPGAIFYKDVSLFLDLSATKNQYLSRAGLISHETAHMWFGDLVTMNWFDDVWTKEVFAGFMGSKIVNPSFPGVNHELRFLSNYSSAYTVDRSLGANEIRQPLENLNMAGTLYGSIIYSKAPVVMKQLELLVGEKTFQKGMQIYLSNYAYENATWPDLIKILDNLSKEDLTAWSKVWVDEPDRPIVEYELLIDQDTLIQQLILKQSDPKKKKRIWMQHLKVRFGYDNEDLLLPVYLKSEEVKVLEASGLRKPNYILPNGAGVGYGYFKMDSISRSFLLENLPNINDSYLRGVIWLNLWDEMLYGNIKPVDMIDLCIRALKTENDILNIQRILSRLNSIFWNFLSENQRSTKANQLESILRLHMNEATTITNRSMYFRSLRSITITDNGYDWLKSIWMKNDSIKGLTLSERDYIAIASELALRGKKDSQQILDSQLNQISNPDRKSRFKFIMASLSNDLDVRDNFFELIKKEENREVEPWVQSAVAYLHHPLRNKDSEKYILPSLELLEEIQRTGDIFFPARFINATLSGHQSVNAKNIVNQFLKDHPNYSPALKLKILQAADNLFRASIIKD